MSWYARSLAPGDVHRGAFDEGLVRAACGLTFLPSRDSGQARYSELPEPERICPRCLTRTKGQRAIPATHARHPEEVISLVVRDLGDSRITLNSDADGGGALTVHAAPLFAALREWLE
ncbi:MAG: hypothetical protein JO281_05900 [Pseudonocardiales bacterium]|nr:hypothetical protein [Pseudonocardiales bacterium]